MPRRPSTATPVIVSSPKVEKPVAVRFAFDQVAEPNLQNVEGPAGLGVPHR